MNHVALWVSHIVIAHRHSSAANTTLRAFGWAPDKPWPDRSESDALVLALQVAAEAAKSPDRFAELAQRYSDDVVTRDSGGSLGGIRAGQLPAEFIDALAVLKPGQVSRVIQTAFGYHIIRRGLIPEEALVSGKHIAIRYVGTYDGPPTDKITRTREEAFILAGDVARTAKEGKVPFESLIARFSENADKAEGGDLGVWSVRDPGFKPAEVERLSKLRLGEISAPMDSQAGFQILLRTEVKPRQQFAISYIPLAFDPSAPPERPDSRKNVVVEASALAKSLSGHPEEFDRMRTEMRCADLEKWTEGRGWPGLTPLAKSVSIGEIATEPLEGEATYFVVRRLDPSAIPDRPPPGYEVPNPRGPDMDALVRHTNQITLASGARAIGRDAPQALKLEGEGASEVTRIMGQLAAAFEASTNGGEARVQRWHAAMDEVRTALGPGDFSRFDEFLNAWATKQVVAGHKW